MMRAADMSRTAAPAHTPAVLVQRGDIQPLVYPHSPARWNGEEIDRLVSWGASIGVSDISLMTGQRVRCELHGWNHAVTTAQIQDSEIRAILAKVYGDAGTARLNTGQAIDIGYEVRPDRDTRIRCRVNATSCWAGRNDGLQITIRILPSTPPRLSEMGIEAAIVAHCLPMQGAVIVSGPTGSGKTTLLGAILRELVEDPRRSSKLLTYEAPIELVYDDVCGPFSLVSQVEIPWHLPSFAEGVRNAMRRKPTNILIGECRDAETIAACAEAAMTGHTVHTTMHATSIPDLLRRAVSPFGPSERQGRAIDIMQALRLGVTQVLLPSTDGKRAAAREFLVFDHGVRALFLDAPVDAWPALSRKIMGDAMRNGTAQTMESSLQQLHAEGRISDAVADEHLRGMRAVAKADEDMTLPWEYPSVGRPAGGVR